jgi:hypothetical protein
MHRPELTPETKTTVWSTMTTSSTVSLESICWEEQSARLGRRREGRLREKSSRLMAGWLGGLTGYRRKVGKIKPYYQLKAEKF